MHCPNCRAAAPAGSRFCNTCGTAFAAGPPAAPARAQQRRAPAPPPPAPSHYAPPGYAPPGYAGQGPQYGMPPAPPPAPPGKRPVWLLLLVCALVFGAAVAGSAFLIQRSRQSVVGGKQPVLPTGSGVEQAVGTETPAGPGVVTGRTPVPVPGRPVVGSSQLPSGMAPGITMSSPPGAPAAPSVFQVRKPGVPQGPSPVVVMPQPQRPGPSAVAAPPRLPQPQPQMADNRDLFNYLAWLSAVEEERNILRDQGLSFAIERMTSLSTAGVLSQLEDLTADAGTAPDPAVQHRRRVNEVISHLAFAINKFQVQFRGSERQIRPRVPPDCQDIHRLLMTSADAELVMMRGILQAINGALSGQPGGIGALLTLQRQAGMAIYTPLRRANSLLDRVYDQRKIDPADRFKLADQSLGGGMGGMGGMFGR